ncbi:MAG TPA: hypothetical protein VH518_15665 [Tepidisphaeraceae bacterium]|jgi:autotransporter-associated beta strand protein
MVTRNCRRALVAAASVGAASLLLSASSAKAQTFLSVDFNGGTIGSSTAVSLGWNGSGYDPVGGQIWQPWGGAGTLGGDGTQLPAGPNNGAGLGTPTLTINKTFTVGPAVASGSVTITLSTQNIAPSVANAINSRDRGAPTTGSVNFGDMYRDFVFVSHDFNRQNGSSPMIITLNGLDPNKTYNFTGYAYDPFQPGQEIYGVANPIQFDYAQEGDANPANGIFGSPIDPTWGTIMGQRISWAPGSDPVSPDDYSTTFKFTTDSAGNATFYTWGNSSAQGAAILSGLQIGTVASSTNTGVGSTAWGAGPWSNGVPDADAAVANFGSVASARTVTIEGSGRTVGVLNIASGGAYTFGGGTLTMSETFAPDATLTGINQPNPTTGHAQINVIGGASLTVTHTISSPVVLAQNTTITTESPTANLTFTGVVSSLVPGGATLSSGLNKLGPGTVRMNGNNTYGGATNILGGNFIVNGTHSGAGHYTVGSGATLGGNGTISTRDDVQQPGTTFGVVPGEVTVWNGGNIAPGDNGIGTLRIDRLSLGNITNHGIGAVNFNIELGSGTADKVVVTDTNGLLFGSYATGAGATGTANFNISVLAGAAVGTYTILDYAGSVMQTAADGSGNPTVFNPIADPLPRFVLPVTSAGGFTFALVNNAINTSIDLVVQAGTTGNGSWTGNTDNNWFVAGNWSGGIPNGVDHVATFGTISSGRYNVNVDGAKTVGTIVFDSVPGYTLSGSAITMQASSGAPAILANTGSHTIASQLNLNNFLFVTVANGATLNLTGVINSTPSGRQLTKGGGGLLQIERINTGTVVVNAGTMRVSAKGTPNSPTGTTIVNGLTIATGAALDLTNNSMIIDYTGAVGTQVTDIRSHLKNNELITSSGTATTRLGYGDNALLAKTTFAGQTVDTTSVLVKYTYAGDADLDGDADGVDIGTWATNFTGELGGTGSMVWTQGDWDYDGDVDGVDAGLWAQAFTGELGGAGLGSVVVDDPNIAPGAAAILRGMGITVVPEPACVATAGLAFAGVASRRRRRD